ncbi:MAG TPA: hypothetical protein VFW87_12205, partial [Pirellulales bacterium]|nr:hypothetical protein [Pirellulales bacterium]
MAIPRNLAASLLAALLLVAGLSTNLLHAQSRIRGESQALGWGGGGGGGGYGSGGWHHHHGGGSVFSPDSKLLAVVRRTQLVLWDLAAKQEVAVLEHDHPVRFFEFSRDGQTLAIAVDREGDSKGQLVIWDIETRAKRFELEKGRGIWQMEFIGDGDKLVVASHGVTKRDAKLPPALRVWNTDTGEELAQLDGNAGRQKKPELYRLAASPDGRLLAVWQLRTATKADIVLWNAESLTTERTLRGVGRVGQLQFSPDGKLLAGGMSVRSKGDRKGMMIGVRLWQVASGKELSATAFDEAGVKSGGAWFAFAPDSKSLIAAAHLYLGADQHETELRLWQFAAGREINLGLALGDPNLIGRRHYWYVNADFSPKGDWLAISDVRPRPQVKLWNAKSRQLVRTLDMTIEADAAAPDQL